MPGAEVQLVIAGLVQSSGYIDSIEKTANRDTGTEWHVEGRDRLAQPADACCDPRLQIKESMTLVEALKLIFGDFGWGTDATISDTNAASTDLAAGQNLRSKRYRSDAKGFGRRALKEYKMHQYRPYAQESVLDFALRVVQRLGFWIWLSSDGKQLILDQPDFAQDPTYKLVRSDSFSNILSGTVKFSVADQPTHIVADSYTKGGEFSRGRSAAIMSNAAVRVLSLPTGLPPVLEEYVKAGAKVVHLPAAHLNFIPQIAPRVRILYLHDDESQTPEHIESYVRQQMALLQRKSLEVHYEVAGHGQIINGEFVPWVIDTVVEVDDKLAGLSENLYVLGRTFTKARSGGTHTNLELIRLYTMSFSDEGGQGKPSGNATTPAKK